MRLAAAIGLCVLAIVVATIPAAAADNGNNQSTQQLCRAADYADLHPTLCPGPFSLNQQPGGHGGGSGGLVGGLLHGLGL